MCVREREREREQGEVSQISSCAAFVIACECNLLQRRTTICINDCFQYLFVWSYDSFDLGKLNFIPYVSIQASFPGTAWRTRARAHTHTHTHTLACARRPTHECVYVSCARSLSLSLSLSLRVYLCVCVCVCVLLAHSVSQSLALSIEITDIYPLLSFTTFHISVITLFDFTLLPSHSDVFFSFYFNPNFLSSSLICVYVFHLARVTCEMTISATR